MATIFTVLVYDIDALVLITSPTEDRRRDKIVGNSLQESFLDCLSTCTVVQKALTRF